MCDKVVVGYGRREGVAEVMWEEHYEVRESVSGWENRIGRHVRKMVMGGMFCFWLVCLQMTEDEEKARCDKIVAYVVIVLKKMI